MNSTSSVRGSTSPLTALPFTVMATVCPMIYLLGCCVRRRGAEKPVCTTHTIDELIGPAKTSYPSNYGARAGTSRYLPAAEQTGNGRHDSGNQALLFLRLRL